MFLQLIRYIVRGIGFAYAQLDAALPMTVIFYPPVLFMILLLAALVVLLIVLFRRHRRKKLEQTAQRMQTQLAAQARDSADKGDPERRKD